MSTCCLEKGCDNCKQHIIQRLRTGFAIDGGAHLREINLKDCAKFGPDDLRELAKKELERRGLKET